MKVLYVFTLIISTNLWALRPIDGVILGKAPIEDMSDPLAEYFIQDKDIQSELSSLRLSYDIFDGKRLKNYCQNSKKLKFSEIFKEKLALRSVVASSQYIVIDKVIKSIAKTAKALKMPKNDYLQMSENIVANYCSQNITVYGHRMMKNNLALEFDSVSENTLYDKVPSHLKKTQAPLDYYQKSLTNQINLFRAFCSWGGDIDRLGFLNNYLQDPIVMNSLFNIMDGESIVWNEGKKKFEKNQSEGVGVLCESLICRHTDFQTFKNNIPYLLGTVDLKKNLENMYCHYLKEAPSGVTYLKGNTKSWHKNEAIFSDVNLKSELLSILNNTPNFFNLFDEQNRLDQMMTAKYESALDNWSDDRLKKLSKELFFEESLEISSQTKIIPAFAKRKDYQIDLVLGLGEIDHHLRSLDKITATFDITLPESFVAWIKERLRRVNLKSANYEREVFYHQIESKLKVFLDQKDKDFIISPFVPNLEKMIAGDLIEWIDSTPHDELQRTSVKVLPVKVNLHYGLFALKYFYDRFEFKYR